MGHFRFTLAILVLISHAGLADESLSRTAVSCFFVLSGFLMQLTLTTNYIPFTASTISRYLSNRFLRIFPLYWTCLLLIALTNNAYFQEKTAGKLIGSLVLDHQNAGNIIGPAWTLPYEISYFFLAPLLTILSIRWFLIVNIAAVLTFIDWKFSELPFLLRPFAYGLVDNSVTAQAIMLFAIGALIYRIKSHFFIWFSSLIFNITTFFCYVFVCVVITGNWIYGRPESFFFWESNARITNTIACLILIVGLLQWNYTESSKSEIFGKLTFPVYLIHWPLIQIFLPNTSFASFLRDFAKNFYLADYLLLTTVVFFISISAGWVWLKIEKGIFAQVRRIYRQYADCR